MVTVGNKLFDWGFFRSKSFGAPVIYIGNLSVSGTGKTPHTEYLIKLLRDSYHVAVLSRGCKRHSREYVLATPQGTTCSIGDEPYQVHTKLLSVTLAVGENRRHDIEQLLSIRESSIEIVLLDDAFRYRCVKPRLSILLTDYHHPLRDDTLLPAGRLRESISGKNRAQIVIVTECSQDTKPIDYGITTRRLNLYPYQQLYFSSFRYGNLQPIFSSANSEIDSTVNELPLGVLANTNILLVTGIASPMPILEELKMYVDQIDSLSFDDHHHLSHRDVQQIKGRFGKLKGEYKLTVTTEKDAIRLVHHPILSGEPKLLIYALPIETETLRNQQDKFNQHITGYIRENTRNGSFSERENAHRS